MTVPAAYILRSYGGGAEQAQLIQTIGASDLSFAISNTTGWTEADGSPLGTVGPFTVIIDRFSDTVEKITCTAVNLTTGVVTVETGGRGADNTDPQGHSPGSVGGVQTCMTSVEAAEANKAVGYVLGSLGGTRTPSNVLALDGSGNPEWVSVPGFQSVSMFGVDNAITGSPPPRLTGAFLMQGGLQSVTFTSGFGPLTFPHAFTNGLLAFVAMIADSTLTVISCTWYNGTASGVDLTLTENGGAATGAASVSYMAWGF